VSADGHPLVAETPPAPEDTQPGHVDPGHVEPENPGPESIGPDKAATEHTGGWIEPPGPEGAPDVPTGPTGVDAVAASPDATGEPALGRTTPTGSRDADVDTRRGDTGHAVGTTGDGGTDDAPAHSGSPLDHLDISVIEETPPRALGGELGHSHLIGHPAEADGRNIHPGPLGHSLPRCLAVANQKGGVGKTTTAVNLGAALAELGYRVLVVDLDPQGNATTGLGVNARNLDASVYDVMLHDVPMEDVIEPTNLRNLFVVPATIDLAGAEIELVPAFSRELRLRRALEPVESDFDFVIIDCPPSLGLLTVNALAAAREVVVPIQCEYYALEGLGQLLRNVGMVRSNLNDHLEVSTIILTMYDARTKLAEQVAEDVREHFGDRVCRNVVPRTVRLSEAPSFGQPITLFDPTSRGAIAYRELAKEVGGGAPQRVG
jgi:chromosome partitioning protein